MKGMTEIGAGVACNEIETLLLSGRHLDFLDSLIQEMNPEMPGAFGWPHAIRTILERIEDSGIDLTDARSEEEIAQLAAGRLRGRTTRGRAPRPSERLSASGSTQRADRRANRSTPPGKDRSRSGRPPRSDHG